MANSIDELPVYRRAKAFCIAVAAILRRPGLRRGSKLWEKLADANDSVMANLREGGEQTTDARFADYVGHSKNSLESVLTRLEQMQYRGLVKPEEFAKLNAEGQEIGRMLGGFMKYLRRSDFKNRGTFRCRSANP